MSYQESSLENTEENITRKLIKVEEELRTKMKKLQLQGESSSAEVVAVGQPPNLALQVQVPKTSPNLQLDEYVAKLSDFLPEFVSVKRLPLHRIFTITNMVRRFKGEDNAPYSGVHVYLNDEIRTNLPGKYFKFSPPFYLYNFWIVLLLGRVQDFLLNVLETTFEVFKKITVLFRYDGSKKQQKVKKSMYLIT